MARTSSQVTFSTFALFPTVGSANLLYIATDVNTTYRWNGSAYVSVGIGISLSYTTVTDPAVNIATSTSNIDNYAGIIITTTTTGNAQTLQTPTTTTAGKIFTVVNNDTSTNSIVVNGSTLAIGASFSFVWDGSSWSTISPVTASQITNIPAGNISATNVQTAINELDTEKANIASPTFTGTVGGITAAMVGAPSGSGTSSGTNTGDQTTITGNAGTATTLATPRAIYGNNFDGSVALTGIIASTYGGTGNGFTKFTGPDVSEKTFTLPNVSATILYEGGPIGATTPSTGAFTTISSTVDVTFGTSVNNVYDQVAGAKPLTVQKSSTSTTIGGSTAAIAIVNGDTTTNNTAQLNFAAITGASTNQYSSAIISAIFGARTNAQYPTGQLAFLTSTTLNAAPTEKMRIDNNGNVGIGVAAPSAKVEIKSLSAGTITDALVLSNPSASTVGTGVALHFQPNGQGGLARTASIKSRQTTTGNYADFGFFVSLGDTPFEALTIATTGRVGILQTSPTARLHLPAGTSAASTAPLKLTTGVALTTPEDGAVEYHSSHLYFTIGSTRYQLDALDSTGGLTLAGRLNQPMAEASYFSTTGTAVTISAQSNGTTNMVVVAPTTTFSNDKDFDNGGGNTGRLRYTGATTRTFHVAVTLSGSPTTNNDEFVFEIAKNGTTMTGCKILQKFDTTTDTQATAIHCMVSLATNDYIELFVGNMTAGRNVTVKTLNLFAMGM